MPILDPQQSYTFSRIFELQAPTDELLQELGYRFQRQAIAWPQYAGDLDRVGQTQLQIAEILPFVDLSSELARREILISRVVTDLVHYTHAQLRIEYPLKVANHLQGSLDYLLKHDADLLVIEAKKEDLRNGFTQLAVELIALDQWENAPEVEQRPQIVGALTTGEVWRFGRLDRVSKTITQDLNLYEILGQIEVIQRILVKVLRP
jgi:hypothetical protein